MAKLNAATGPSTGATIGYVSYLGGPDLDDTAFVAAGPDGAAYVLGDTFGDQFPAQDALAGTSTDDDFNATLTKIEPHTNGNAQIGYATLFPSSHSEYARAVETDAAGGVYVALHAFSNDLPGPCAVPGAIDFQHPWVARVAPDTGGAVAIDWSTRLAGPTSGSGGTTPHGVAPDGANALYVVGATTSGYPTVDAAQPTIGSSQDAFVTRVSKTGSGCATVVTGSTPTPSPSPTETEHVRRPP